MSNTVLLTNDGHKFISQSFKANNLYLGLGNLAGYTGSSWTSEDIPPTFDASNTSLVNLLGLRKATDSTFVELVTPTSEIFTIANVDISGLSGGEYLRLISPTTEYCVWIDKTGSNFNPTSVGQQSVRVNCHNVNAYVALSNAIDALSEFSSIYSNELITITCNIPGNCSEIDVSSGFTLAVVQNGVNPGSISYGGRSWNTTNNSTQYLYLSFSIDPDDISASTIYQIGLFMNPAINPDISIGKMFLFPSDISNPGTLVTGTNVEPIVRSSFKRNRLNFVLTF